jgi:hypothetical protein
MRVRYAAVLTALLFAGLGCVAQPPAGVVANGSNVSSNGCNRRPEANMPEAYSSTGDHGERRKIRHSSPGADRTRHLDMLTDDRYPNGEPLAVC